MLCSWTEKEKYQLLHSLKKHGSSNLAIVAKEIPTKSLNEVEHAVNLYSATARKSLKADNTSRYRQAPIDKWIHFVKRHTPNVQKVKDLATVLKIFSFHEQQSSENSDAVSFQDLYLFLSDLSLGNAPKELNHNTHMFLMKNIHELAQKCKREVTEAELTLARDLNKKSISKRVEVKEDNLDDDDEGDVVEEILENNPVLNPLKIKRSFLRNTKSRQQRRLSNSRPSRLRELLRAMKKGLV